MILRRMKAQKASSLLFPALVLMLVSVSAEAGKVSWKDLDVVVPMPNPLLGMTIEQKIDFQAARDFQEYLDRASADASTEMPAEVTDARRRLAVGGIDTDALLDRIRLQTRQSKQAVIEAMSEKFDGRKIEISGYVVPLEFDGLGVIEFLLVPWAGACIHTPPPALDQIVWIKTETPFPLPSLETAVTVAGKVHVGMKSDSLFVTDGMTDVTVGYHLSASDIDLYKN